MQETIAPPKEIETIREHANAISELQSKVAMLSANRALHTQARSSLSHAHNALYDARQHLKAAIDRLTRTQPKCKGFESDGDESFIGGASDAASTRP